MTSTEKEEEKLTPIIFGDLTDVTLVVDNQEFKVNKTFLACRSEVFKAMFCGEFKETKEDRVEIKDVSVRNFRRLLEVIYIGKVSDPSKFLEFPLSTSCDYHYSYSYVSQELETLRHSFWNDTTEMLNIADRFNLSPIVKNYIESAITIAICSCSQANCYVCFNSFIFAILNGMDVSKSKKKYPLSLYQSWGTMDDQESFPDVHKKAMKILSQHLQ